MTWYDDEKSVQDSAPIELFTFAAPSATYRISTGENDLVYGGNTYLAAPSSRSSLLTPIATDSGNDFTIQMAASHALPQYYKATGFGPREMQCTVARYQPTSGVAMQIGAGYVETLNFGGRPPMATFRIATTSDAFAVGICAVDVGKLCRHTLYDARCTVARSGFIVTTTISTISADRKTITVASMSGSPGSTADDWAKHGELYHPASTERRAVKSQSGGTTLVLYHKLPAAIVVGNTVNVYAGCDKTVGTCFLKFTNVINFGNLPHMPTSNPWYVDPRYKS